MSIESIRMYYGVTAKRGMRVIYSGGKVHQHGTITGANGHRLRIRIDGEKTARAYHPTWEIQYPATEQ